jgi:hypothetical protein
MENWADKDYDEKYADYLMEYIKLKKIFVNTDAHPSAEAAFTLLKKRRVTEGYEDLFSSMVKEFENNGILLDEPKVNAIKTRLSGFKSSDTDIDFGYISELRKIEEEEY